MDYKHREREAILKLHLNGKQPTEIFKLLKNSGAKMRTIYNVVRRYLKTGSVNDRKRSGRPRNKRTPDMLKAVEARIQSNPLRSGKSLARQFKVSYITMTRALNKDLQMPALKRTQINMRKCQLCYGSSLTNSRRDNNSDRYDSQLQDIISSCGKYLSNTFLQSQIVSWDISIDGDPFCEQCGENVRKLRLFDIQLEEVNKQIQQLVMEINEKISLENQSNQIQSNDNNTQVNQLKILENQDAFANHKNDCENYVDYTQDESGAHVFGDTTENNKTTDLDLPNDDQIEGLSCKNCRKIFPALDILKDHKCELFKCSGCKKSFASRISMAVHSRVHNKQKPQKSDVFNTSSNFEKPFVQYSADKSHYQCTTCKKKCKTKYALKNHENVHRLEDHKGRKSKSDDFYKTVRSRIRNASEKDKYNSSDSENEEYECRSRLSGGSNLRRSTRIRKSAICEPNDNDECEERDGSSSETNDFIGSRMGNEHSSDYETGKTDIKIENDYWIKEEPEDFSE